MVRGRVVERDVEGWKRRGCVKSAYKRFGEERGRCKKMAKEGEREGKWIGEKRWRVMEGKSDMKRDDRGTDDEG